METEAINQCAAAAARSDIVACCANIGGNFCSDLEDDCRIDACIGANGNISAITGQVQALFIDPVLADCNRIVLPPSNIVPRWTQNPTWPSVGPTKAPSTNPSKAPTRAPTGVTGSP